MGQFLIVSYDICNDRRRYKVMKTVEGYGRRVQYSVFECDLKPAEIQKMITSLSRLIKKEDSIRIYSIGAEDVARIKILGHGSVKGDQAFFIT